MTDEAQSCCGHAGSSPYVSSVSYSYTVVKTTISFSSIHNEMMAGAVPRGEERDKSIREKNVQQQIMASLPDIKELLKPWYFQGAQKHNVNAVKQAALDHVKNSNCTQGFEVVFRQMKYENAIHEDPGKNVCGMSQKSAEGQATVAAMSDLLSDDDKCCLEKMHAQAVAHNDDTKVVDAMATQVASERVFSRDEHRPVLNRDYFDRVISRMNVWKSHLHDHSMMARMRGVLS